MNPLVKYTLGRVGLFVGALLILWPLRGIGPWATVLIALVVSIVLSWFVLRGWRDELSRYLEARAQRREAERRLLRSTLDEEEPGEDDPGRAG